MELQRSRAEGTKRRRPGPAEFTGGVLTALLLSGALHAATPTEAEKLQWAQRRVVRQREAALESARLRSVRLERGDACASRVRRFDGANWLALLHRLRPDAGPPAAIRDSSELPAASLKREDLAVFHYTVEAPVPRVDGACELRILARPSFDPGLGIDSRRMDRGLAGIRFRLDADSGRALGRSIIVRTEGGVREVELPEGALPSRLSQFELFPVAPSVEFSNAGTREARFVRPDACAESVRLDEVFESWLSQDGRGGGFGAGVRGVRVEGDDFWGRPVVMCVDSGRPWPVRWRTSSGSGVAYGWSESLQSRIQSSAERAGE